MLRNDKVAKSKVIISYHGPGILGVQTPPEMFGKYYFDYFTNILKKNQLEPAFPLTLYAKCISSLTLIIRTFWCGFGKFPFSFQSRD
jgi:hypothetical protein